MGQVDEVGGHQEQILLEGVDSEVILDESLLPAWDLGLENGQDLLLQRLEEDEVLDLLVLLGLEVHVDVDLFLEHFEVGDHLFEGRVDLLELVGVDCPGLDLVDDVSLLLPLHDEVLEGDVDVRELAAQRHLLDEVVVHLFLLRVLPELLHQFRSQVYETDLLQSAHEVFEVVEHGLDLVEVQLLSEEDHQELAKVHEGVGGNQVGLQNFQPLFVVDLEDRGGPLGL